MNPVLRKAPAVSLLLPAILQLLPAQAPREVPLGFDLLPAWDSLPYLHDRPCLQASSWDRSGGNRDSGNFLRVEKDGEQVLMEARGPGCIHRIWCTGILRPGIPATKSPECRWRFWIDGEKKPRLDLSVAELFGLAGRKPFVPPLARTFRSGRGPWEGHASMCYVPIPFEKSIRITGRNLSFYQIDYHLYPPGTRIRSFSLPLEPREEEALRRGAAMFARKGSPPLPIPPSEWRDFTPGGPLPLEPGGTFSTTLDGAGSIRGIRIGVEPVTPETLRGLVLEISWDGNPFPSVRVPLGDFFGTGPVPRPFRALPFGRTAGGFYCWFPMPFRSGAELKLRNDLPRKVRLSSFRIAWRPLPTLAPNAARFHGAYRQVKDIPGRRDFRVLQARGRGKFLGCNLTMQSRPGTEGIYFLEGDEKIYVDGENWPSRYLGTGTEDYFNGAYFWNALRFEHGPVSGLTFLDWGMRRVCAYRVHFPDDVSFRKEFVMDIEHGPVSDHPSDYQGAAWWYQLPPAPAPPLPPWRERIARTIVPRPLRPPESIALEASPRVEEGVLRKRAWKDLSPFFLGGEAWECSPGKEGGRFTWTFHVPARERYDLAVQLARGPLGGPVRFLLDGDPLREISTLGPSLRPGLLVNLPARLLAPGPHDLTLLLPRRGAERVLWTGLSAGPTGPMVDRWYLLGPFPSRKPEEFAREFGPEKRPGGKVDLEAPYSGEGGRSLSWKPWKAAYVDLCAALGGGGGRAAYGYSRIEATAPLETVLFVGKDDGIRLWLNGRLLLSRNTWSHGTPDRLAVPVRFRKGTNHLLVKCANLFGGWGFCIRPADPERLLSW